MERRRGAAQADNPRKELLEAPTFDRAIPTAASDAQVRSGLLGDESVMGCGEGVELLESHTRTGHGEVSDSAIFVAEMRIWEWCVPDSETGHTQIPLSVVPCPEFSCARKWVLSVSGGGGWVGLGKGEQVGKVGIVAGMATPFPALDGSAPVLQQFDQAPEFGIDASKRHTATMETSMGTMVIALDAVNAPNTVNNFVFLAAHHYYDGVIFHRIINGFMCQGGDPSGTGHGDRNRYPGYKFNDEPVKQKYQIGSLAMANAGPNTNGSQFFLISGPSGVGLPPQYNHFGQVVKGLEIVDAMQRVDTDHSDRPRTPVVINSVTVTVAD